jgi:hypothetical protein
MKRVLQILLASVFLLSACSKEKSLEFSPPDPNGGGPGGGGGGGGSTTGYFFKCKIGGTAKTFNVQASAATETDQGMTITFAGGKANDNPSDLEAFTLMITTDAALTTGTYKVDDITSGYEVLATYTTNSTTKAWVALTGAMGGDAFRIDVTSISSTEIAGTFRGTMFEIDINNPSPTPPQKSITEGQFKLKFQ